MIHIDMDIIRYLPRNEPVIADGGYIFQNHPIHDQVAIDIRSEKRNPDLLVTCADKVARKLESSGLFRQVGMKEIRGVFPDLMDHILRHLPVMFSQADLEEQIQPLLERDRIRKRLESIYSDLLNLNSIGQSAAFSKDPLGLRDKVIARLRHLAPGHGATIYKGNILSVDGKHLLLVANPVTSGTDTAFARKVNHLMGRIQNELRDEYTSGGENYTLTAMGAYRAALDNEMIVRRDVNRAIILAMVGIAVLLILAFPRPLIGLFAFLPAVAGTAAAFFLFSLFNRSMSIMALGFGGAVISITVDHGIAYLLFLDQSRKTYGKEASSEVRALGLLATLTTMGAFGILYFFDFPIFQQLGLFTAMGIGFSFLFVHTVFPKIFPTMPPARSRTLPLKYFAEKISTVGKKGIWITAGFSIIMIFFAKPVFNVNLSTMNTVSGETAASEQLLTRVWGQEIFSNIYLMNHGDSIRTIQQKGDELLSMIETDLRSGVLLSGFVPSMVFPGAAIQKKNYSAWKRFWDRDKIDTFKKDIKDASDHLGFSDDAFDPFYETISIPSWTFKTKGIPEKFHNLLNISTTGDKFQWNQFSSFSPGKSYDPEVFWKKYSPLCRIFDPALFSERLGSLLFFTFVRILMILGVGTALLLFLFFLDLKLTMAALLPLGFALICTLGTLKLVGHPLDIPGLMLSIVVMGMGVDYSLFIVRSYQRYGDASHPCFGLIRMAVFMAAGSTIIGFGVLCFSQHPMLRSVGLTSVFGITYSFIGAFVILPPIMGFLFDEGKSVEITSASDQDRILRHFRNVEAYPRFFARFKFTYDSMFSELPRFFDPSRQVRTVLDIGCGYGVPACWLIERFPECKIYGFDPNPERTRVAARALGKNGEVVCAGTPDIPELPHRVDTVLMMDMIHFITDDELELTLKRIHRCLKKNGNLIIRAVIPPGENPHSWMWRWDSFKMKMARTPSYYRSTATLRKMIIKAGFMIKFTGLSGGNKESVWFEGIPCAD